MIQATEAQRLRALSQRIQRVRIMHDRALDRLTKKRGAPVWLLQVMQATLVALNDASSELSRISWEAATDD